MSKYRVTIERIDGELINGQNQLIAEGDGTMVIIDKGDAITIWATEMRKGVLTSAMVNNDHVREAALAAVNYMMHEDDAYIAYRDDEEED